MFNREDQFPIRNLSGDKLAVLRYPSDEAWAERLRKHPIIRRDLGRNKTEFEPRNTRAFDAELFKTLLVSSEGEPFDEYEAQAAIDRLDRTEILSVEQRGADRIVTMKVYGGTATKHLIGRISQKVISEYYAACNKRRHEGNNNVQIRAFLEPGGAAYDELCKSAEGYVGGVPLNHKAQVVIAAFDHAMEAYDDDTPPEE